MIAPVPQADADTQTDAIIEEEDDEEVSPFLGEDTHDGDGAL